MSSLATMTDDNVPELYNYKELKEYIIERLKMASEVIIGGHRFNFEIDIEDDFDFFIQKAKEDLRETPETVAQGIKELKELLTGTRHKSFSTVRA